MEWPEPKMSRMLYVLLWLVGFYPFLSAWLANRNTTLLYTTSMAIMAWVTWGLAFWGADVWSVEGASMARYLALCSTALAGVAVLGARRPGVGPWNFVLAGLLAVMLLPVAESLVSGKQFFLETARTLFLACTLLLLTLNYLPTRLGPAAFLLGACLGLEVFLLAYPDASDERWSRLFSASRLLFLFLPWAAFVGVRWRPPPSSEFDKLWLDFRDHYGLVWGQRVREQFNASARHANWKVVLRWQGLRLLHDSHHPGPEERGKMVEVLQALLQRFGEREFSPLSPHFEERGFSPLSPRGRGAGGEGEEDT